MVRYLNGAPFPMAIAVDLDLNAIEETLFKINKQEQMNLALITASGKIIAGFSENKGPLNIQDHSFRSERRQRKKFWIRQKQTFNCLPTMVFRSPLLKKPTEKFNWTIISINDESRLKAALSRLETYYLELLAAGLILSLFISFWLPNI